MEASSNNCFEESDRTFQAVFPYPPAKSEKQESVRQESVRSENYGACVKFQPKEEDTLNEMKMLLNAIKAKAHKINLSGKQTNAQL